MYACIRVSMFIAKHKSPTTFLIDTVGITKQYIGTMIWDQPTAAQIATYNFQYERVENAAECVALATLQEKDNLVMRKRMEKATGADWLLGSPDESTETLYRFEVSGIDKVRRLSEVDYRLQEKVNELKKGQDRVPGDYDGIAIVVGLNIKYVKMQHVTLVVSALEKGGA